MIGPEFASCWLKIGRAEEHFNTIKTEVIAWHETQPYVVTKNCDAEGRRHSLVIDIRNPPPLDRWALVAGDCIHNLRSALDNLVYAVALRESGGLPVKNFDVLQFPITSSAQNFASQKRKIASLRG